MRSFVVEPMQYGRLSWPATRRTSSRRPAPRASTWPWPTCACWPGARRVSRRRRRRPGRLLRELPAPGVAGRALLVVDDLDAAPPARAGPVRGAAAALPARYVTLVAGGRDDAGRELRGARACLRAGCSTACSRAGPCPAVDDGPGCRPCSTSRRRWRGRRRRPGSWPPRTRRRSPRLPGGGLRRRGAGRRGGLEREPGGAARAALRARRRPGPQVHRGATSQDVLDTAAMLVAGARSSRCSRTWTARRSRRRAGARAPPTPMAGRTLLQQAVPMTFGLMAAGWMNGLEEAASGCRRAA